MLNDGDGLPEDEILRSAGAGKGVVKAGDVSDGGKCLPLRLTVLARDELDEFLVKGDREFAEEEPGTEGPGGVVAVRDVEFVSHSRENLCLGEGKERS